MNFVIWIIAGGIIGWVASSIMHSREGLLVNILVGILGAVRGRSVVDSPVWYRHDQSERL